MNPPPAILFRYSFAGGRFFMGAKIFRDTGIEKLKLSANLQMVAYLQMRNALRSLLCVKQSGRWSVDEWVSRFLINSLIFV